MKRRSGKMYRNGAKEVNWYEKRNVLDTISHILKEGSAWHVSSGLGIPRRYGKCTMKKNDEVLIFYRSMI
jgi:hypothetical protein